MLWITEGIQVQMERKFAARNLHLPRRPSRTGQLPKVDVSDSDAQIGEQVTSPDHVEAEERRGGNKSSRPGRVAASTRSQEGKIRRLGRPGSYESVSIVNVFTRVTSRERQ